MKIKEMLKNRVLLRQLRRRLVAVQIVRLRSCIITSLCVIFAAVLYAPTAYAITNGDIAIAPAEASDPDDPRTQSWFIYKFQPGVLHQDKVYIENQSSETKTLKLYPVDAYTTPQGGFALHNENDPRKEIGKWITLEKTDITLKPGENTTIPFTYTVPENIEPGEYAGGLVAQDSSAIQGQGIAVVKRVGVRVYHTIPGERNERINLIASEMKTAGNERWFEATVENTGNVTVTLSLQEEIMRKDMSVALLKSEEQTLLPRSHVVLKTNTWKDPLFGSFKTKGGFFKGNEKLLDTPSQAFVIINISLFIAAGIIIVLVISFFIFAGLRRKKK